MNSRTLPAGSRTPAIAASTVLLLIPAVCAVAAVIGHRAAGPGWLAPNYDVEYNYLLNALRLQQGLPIFFFIQPATTIALLYAAIIHVSHAVAPVGSADVVQDVWRYPEAYVGRVHASLVVLLLCASFAAGVLVWRRTKSVSAGVALQAGLMLLSAIAESSGMIWPETIVIVLGVLFAGTLALFILDGGSSSGLCVALGVVGALAVAAKVTFAIVALAPAILSRSLKTAVLYVAVLIVGLGVLLAPIFWRLPLLIDFLSSFALRRGAYGEGNAGFDQRAYLGGLAFLARQNKMPVAVILLSLGVLVFFALRRTAVVQDTQRSELRALGLVTLVELAMYAVVARQPYPRYLIPAVLLMGVNLVLIQRVGLAVARRRAVQAVLMVGLAVVLAVWLRNTVSALASARLDAAEHAAAVEAAASLRRSGAVVVMGSWASSPAYALAMGQFWIGDAWSMVAEQVYPGQLFLTWDGYLRTWNEGLGTGWEWPNVNPPLSPAGKDAEWRRVAEFLKGRRVIVQGEWNTIVPGLRSNPRISFQAIRRSRLESLIELRPR